MFKKCEADSLELSEIVKQICASYYCLALALFASISCSTDIYSKIFKCRGKQLQISHVYTSD